MSRIGKQLIKIPAKVVVATEGDAISVQGPLGLLTRRFSPTMKIEIKGEEITVIPERQTVNTQALWGTTAAHLRNMILGVTKGYEKKLLIEGVGYRAAVNGSQLVLNLGFSHPITLIIPAGLKIMVEKGLVIINGSDKELVGQFAASLRALKKPEPYKGKGIRYETEIIRRKEGKRVTA